MDKKADLAGPGVSTYPEILDMYPDLPRRQRDTMVLQKYLAVFINGIGKKNIFVVE